MSDSVGKNTNPSPEELQAYINKRKDFMEQELPLLELEEKYYSLRARISESIYKDAEYRQRLAALQAPPPKDTTNKDGN